MKFLKNNYKLIVGILIGTILSGGIVYAAVSASQVTYKNNTSVETALNELYGIIKNRPDTTLNFVLRNTNNGSTSVAEIPSAMFSLYKKADITNTGYSGYTTFSYLTNLSSGTVAIGNSVTIDLEGITSIKMISPSGSNVSGMGNIKFYNE